MSKRKRQSKKIEIWAKLYPTGLNIPSPVNKNRIMLAAQKMPVNGEDVKLTIEFTRRSKSAESMGLYWGGVLPLWIAHMKDLVKVDSLKKEPLILQRLVREKKILKSEIDSCHSDFMLKFRPIQQKNWLTGRIETKRDSIADMDSYNAMLYITEVCQFVEDNTGMILNTEEFKNSRDNMDLIIQEGPSVVKKLVSG